MEFVPENHLDGDLPSPGTQLTAQHSSPSQSTQDQHQVGSSASAFASLSPHHTTTPSASQPPTAERHQEKLFRQHQEGICMMQPVLQGEEPRHHQTPSSFPKALLSKAPPSSNAGSSLAETQDLSQQSHGATAILWKAPQHWSRRGTATHRSGHCLAHGLAPSGSSESWGDVTHTETLPGVWSITPRHSWDPSRSSAAKKGEFASHQSQKGDERETSWRGFSGA